MDLRAELDCPQCGAPITLEESERLLTCPYCKVSSFLSAPMYHFVLPHLEMGGDLLFVPYLRFKGVVYCINDSEIEHRIVDISRCGLPMKALPLSLGLRPQTMRLRLAKPNMGTFLKNYATVDQAIAGISRQMSAPTDQIRHFCAIGETVSRIYLPIAQKNGQAFDAVSGDLLGKLPPDRDLFAPVREADYAWQPEALAALCPHCGGNLEGAAAAIVLLCRGCDSAWQAGPRGYEQVTITVLAQANPAERAQQQITLPFWRIETEADGAVLKTRADFARLSGQPYPLRPEWEGQALAFWSPAFKVRPKLYLQISRQLSILQPEVSAASASLPAAIHTITLPLGEAVEALRLILASTSYRKKEVVSLLPHLALRPRSAALVFLSFTPTSHDLIHEQLAISLNRKAVEYGNGL